MSNRRGFFTPDQEKQLDDLIELKGIAETLDGPAIRLADNQGLELLKGKLEAISPDAVEITEQVVDAIFAALPKAK